MTKPLITGVNYKWLDKNSADPNWWNIYYGRANEKNVNPAHFGTFGWIMSRAYYVELTIKSDKVIGWFSQISHKTLAEKGGVTLKTIQKHLNVLLYRQWIEVAIGEARGRAVIYRIVPPPPKTRPDRV